MAQVIFLSAELPTRNSSLQISAYPKQEDLAVRGSLFDRKAGTWMWFVGLVLATGEPDRYRLSESESAPKR
jgi:hypothetical protein